MGSATSPACSRSSAASAPTTCCSSPTGAAIPRSASPTRRARTWPAPSRLPHAAGPSSVACCGVRTTFCSSPRTRTARSARRSTRPAGSACSTCASRPSAHTTRSWSSFATRPDPPTTWRSSAASTCASAVATGPTTAAIRKPCRCPPPTARIRRGMTCSWRYEDRRSAMLRLSSGSAGRTPRPSAGIRCTPSGRSCTATRGPRARCRLRGRTRRSRAPRASSCCAPTRARSPGYPFAPEGERSVAHGYAKALRRASDLVYVEDQYLWSTEVASVYATALRRQPHLRMVFVIPGYPEVDGRLSRPPNILGRLQSLAVLQRAAGPDRLGVYWLENDVGTPIYVHAKVVVVDDDWASVGLRQCEPPVVDTRLGAHGGDVGSGIHHGRGPARDAGRRAPGPPGGRRRAGPRARCSTRSPRAPEHSTPGMQATGSGRVPRVGCVPSGRARSVRSRGCGPRRCTGGCTTLTAGRASCAAGGRSSRRVQFALPSG